MRHRLSLLAIVIVTVATSLPTVGHAQSVSSVEIALAIDRGVQKLMSWQREDGSFGGYDGSANDYPTGVNALAIYTLLKSGIPANDPVIQRAVERAKDTPFERVYVVATLVMALDALKDRQWDARIGKAAAWLEDNIDPGTGLWGYPHGGPDLSNTQFAALAMWTAERHGYKARTETWGAVVKATLEKQNPDGGFGYRPADRPESGGSTTTAAIVILAVGKQRFTSETGELPLARAAQAGIDRAWAWLDQTFSATGNPAWTTGRLRERQPGYGHILFHYYFLYGLERATALTRHGDLIGGRNWYEEGALHLLAHENPEGGFSELLNTCFALLFLRRATFTGLTQESIKLAGPRAEYWRYTTTPPAQGWTDRKFDDAQWVGGAGAFGKFGTEKAQVRTPWTTPDIWIRRAFDWKPSLGELRLFVLSDDGCEVYVNGVLAAEQPTWTQKWIALAVSKEAQATLKDGRNVLAAHAHNVGGNQVIDVRLEDFGELAARARGDHSPARWWNNKPAPEVPFLRQWLVLGPFDNRDDGLLNESLLPDDDVRAKDGTRTRNFTWKAARTFNGFFDFTRTVKADEHCVYYLATHLRVPSATAAVLWLGCDDGFRVLLNGELRALHHGHQKATHDEFPVPLALKEGANQLLIKVENWTDVSGVYARVTNVDGKPLPGLRPVLDAEATTLADLALASPSYFTLPELLEMLPIDGKPILDFASQRDLERVAIDQTTPDYPRWFENANAKDTEYAPMAGGRGFVAMWPLSADQPARLIRKVTVSFLWRTFLVRVSPDVRKAPGASSCRVRVGVFDGQMHWLAEQVVKSNAKGPGAKQWPELRGNLEPFVDRTVLLIVECAPDHDVPCAFIDDASVVK